MSGVVFMLAWRFVLICAVFASYSACICVCVHILCGWRFFFHSPDCTTLAFKNCMSDPYLCAQSCLRFICIVDYSWPKTGSTIRTGVFVCQSTISWLIHATTTKKRENKTKKRPHISSSNNNNKLKNIQRTPTIDMHTLYGHSIWIWEPAWHLFLQLRLERLPQLKTKKKTT